MSKIEQNNVTPPLLIMFVGIPGSGKTTFARQLADKIGAVTLNSDAMRVGIWGSREAVNASRTTDEGRLANNEMTFGAMNYATEQILKAGGSVVYDCNANRISQRAEKHAIAARYGGRSIIIRIDTPYDVAIQRIQEREENDDQLRKTAENAKRLVDRIAADIEEPTSDEVVVRISGGVPFEEQYAAFQTQLDNLRA